MAAPSQHETLAEAPAAAEAGDAPDDHSLVRGSDAPGAFLTKAILRVVRRTGRPLPERGPRALEAPVGTLELMEGRACYYERSGTGVPLVLLHSLNAAASSFEMRPLFDHLSETTERPVYALDWLGFGHSDRPPVHYTPALYRRQLRRFLSEKLGRPADVIALSLGCEYAAQVACRSPALVRRLVGIAPTALGADEEGSTLKRALIRLAGALGLFELFFHFLTQRDTLARFYREQVFLHGDKLPKALVDYANATMQVQGAHRAPRFFVEGSLFTRDQARAAYAALRVPTCFIVPESAETMIQRFDRASAIAARNTGYLRIETFDAGLLPQWEEPKGFFEAFDALIA